MPFGIPRMAFAMIHTVDFLIWIPDYHCVLSRFGDRSYKKRLMRKCEITGELNALGQIYFQIALVIGWPHISLDIFQKLTIMHLKKRSGGYLL